MRTEIHTMNIEKSFEFLSSLESLQQNFKEVNERTGVTTFLNKRPEFAT